MVGHSLGAQASGPRSYVLGSVEVFGSWGCGLWGVRALKGFVRALKRAQGLGDEAILGLGVCTWGGIGVPE